jgi:hypothetical protein
MHDGMRFLDLQACLARADAARRSFSLEPKACPPGLRFWAARYLQHLWGCCTNLPEVHLDLGPAFAMVHHLIGDDVLGRYHQAYMNGDVAAAPALIDIITRQFAWQMAERCEE